MRMSLNVCVAMGINVPHQRVIQIYWRYKQRRGFVCANHATDLSRRNVVASWPAVPSILIDNLPVQELRFLLKNERICTILCSGKETSSSIASASDNEDMFMPECTRLVTGVRNAVLDNENVNTYITGVHAECPGRSVTLPCLNR